MIRHAFLYGLALALAALLLAWIDYRHAVKLWPTETYALVIALLFAGLGLWAGYRLTPRTRGPEFVRNEKALAALGISAREVEVLDLLAQGCANKVIARRLSISPNTVKTHVARLYEKLEVESRTQAIGKARSLDLLP